MNFTRIVRIETNTEGSSVNSFFHGLLMDFFLKEIKKPEEIRLKLESGEQISIVRMADGTIILSSNQDHAVSPTCCCKNRFSVHDKAARQHFISRLHLKEHEAGLFYTYSGEEAGGIIFKREGEDVYTVATYNLGALPKS